MVWGQPSLIYGPITHSPFALGYFRANHLAWGHYGPTQFLSIWRPHFLHRFALPWHNLCDSVMCLPIPPQNLHPGFEAQT
jgi:hypothetical protein